MWIGPVSLLDKGSVLWAEKPWSESVWVRKEITPCIQNVRTKWRLVAVVTVRPPYRLGNIYRCTYENVSKSFLPHRKDRKRQEVQLRVSRYCSIAVFWVSLVTLAAITLCVASYGCLLCVLSASHDFIVEEQSIHVTFCFQLGINGIWKAWNAQNSFRYQGRWGDSLLNGFL
jgi:hypothetical protein